MKRNQAGFTLIELVMVIVILGVLAAVALPKFVDLKGDAQLAAVQGAAGALSSYAAINYASYQIGADSTKNVALASTGAGDALKGSMGSWDANVIIVAGSDASCATPAAGGTANALLSYNGGPATATANATIICTG